ncbi:serine/threonine protein kinase [Crenobacter luteus]|uniref:Serine/threonine protein kinase n=1 Tax=Crenobacter luteus TaxID=1452487 RepID=A0A165FDI3_9NEIS|nr:serine/threonine-protein kinase [Crenobacter luteus]KZE32902.1 serine/threonine protein kinase [Crenobacter luteus]
MTQSAPQKPLPAGYRLGDYTVVRQLSVGGFSIVYLALDDQERTFAIKEYLPHSLACRSEQFAVTVKNELDRDAFNLGLKCFFEEGRVLAGIHHPNVVRVSNFFRANHTVYMVMEYADGRPLSRELELAGGRLAERRLRRVFAHLVAGLREVHLNRLLHLDLKPANIYLRRNGAPLLLDFGAARETLMRGSRQFASMYTPGFAAPEQYQRDGALGPWTDIYAIGACLYTCMGGTPPPPANERVQHDALAPARDAFAAYYSPELTALTDRCLALSSDERPASLMQLQKLLMAEGYAAPATQRAEPALVEGGDVPSRLVSWLKHITRRVE